MRDRELLDWGEYKHSLEIAELREVEEVTEVRSYVAAVNGQLLQRGVSL